jgi:hypothetical protein
MKPYDREFVLSLRMLECCQEPLKVADGAIDPTVPQTPFNGSDISVDGRKGFEKTRSRSNEVTGDLLHWLNFLRDVKPIDDVDCHLGIARGNPLRISAPS